jgi:hypothetical protein
MALTFSSGSSICDPSRRDFGFTLDADGMTSSTTERSPWPPHAVWLVPSRLMNVERDELGDIELAPDFRREKLLHDADWRRVCQNSQIMSQEFRRCLTQAKTSDVSSTWLTSA